MKIYTKTGDKGETSLFGGKRVSKDALRIEAYGTIDELNSFIGLTVTEAAGSGVVELLTRIQSMLFDAGADLASPEGNDKIKRVPDEYIAGIEKEIDYFEAQLEPLRNFILPGGTRSSALLHICRTVARRAERRIVELGREENINENLIIFLNRLSDLFFVLSRFENKVSNVPDVNWKQS